MTVRTPGTTPSKTDRMPVSTPGGPKAKEEKIVVTVRLRPLNKKEQSAKDQVAWECVDDHTIVYKPQPQERLTQSAAFTFGNFSEFSFSLFFFFFSFLLLQFDMLNFKALLHISEAPLKCWDFVCFQIKSLVLEV